jgi:hypothetical protein
MLSRFLCFVFPYFFGCVRQGAFLFFVRFFLWSHVGLVVISRPMGVWWVVFVLFSFLFLAYHYVESVLYAPDDGRIRSKHVVHAKHGVSIPELCRMNNNKHYLAHNMTLQYIIVTCLRHAAIVDTQKSVNTLRNNRGSGVYCVLLRAAGGWRPGRAESHCTAAFPRQLRCKHGDDATVLFVNPLLGYR